MKRDHRILRQFRALRTHVATTARSGDPNALGKIQGTIEELISESLDSGLCPYTRTARIPLFSLAGFSDAIAAVASLVLASLDCDAVQDFRSRLEDDLRVQRGAESSPAKERDRTAAARDTVVVIELYLVLASVLKLCASIASTADDDNA